MRRPIATRRLDPPITRPLTVRGLVGTLATFGVLLAALFAPVLTAGAVAGSFAVAFLARRVTRLRRRARTPASGRRRVRGAR